MPVWMIVAIVAAWCIAIMIVGAWLQLRSGIEQIHRHEEFRNVKILARPFDQDRDVEMRSAGVRRTVHDHVTGSDGATRAITNSHSGNKDRDR